MITQDLVVFYLANIIKMSQTDGKMNPKAKMALKNNITFRTPMHPARLRCENSMYAG